MDKFTLSDNIVLIQKDSLISTFNRCVTLLRPFLRGTTFALDSTIIETKHDFPGCGKSKRKNKNGDDTEHVYYGFKLFILYEVKSRIIVALDIVPANENDSKFLLSMVKKGVENIGKDSIKLVVADRGFIDGAQMWNLKHNIGIDFIIPAKAGMTVRDDAISLRKEYERSKSKIVEWKYGKGTCRGYGVEGLLSYLQYNPTGKKDNKKTNGGAINAVVVTTWRDKPVTTGDEVVLLTSLLVEADATVATKGYRQRSLIENTGFREMKQATYLKCLPKRKGEKAEDGAYLHIILCVLAHTLFYAFLSWRKKSEPDNPVNESCMRRWRRTEFETQEPQIMVIANGEYYALLEVSELLDILEVKQKYRIQMNC
jgi:hypothetical protein